MIRHIIVLALVGLVGCAAFTPHFDPKDWPCGDPKAHWCTLGQTCCADRWDCGGTIEFTGCPAHSCCFNGGESAAPGEKRLVRPMMSAAR